MASMLLLQDPRKRGCRLPPSGNLGFAMRVVVGVVFRLTVSKPWIIV